MAPGLPDRSVDSAPFAKPTAAVTSLTPALDAVARARADGSPEPKADEPNKSLTRLCLSQTDLSESDPNISLLHLSLGHDDVLSKRRGSTIKEQKRWV
jgi:hypothetical protein